ncbi:coiled-coil domain-containing protein AGAP005037-like isoform X2 [Photinus pyralis]|uniref:coiled-coil domain-containing protein AGAP005037-like isoform X2 n=1 Tax=Photinus pyralis TaxID=7054 RepID=UPI0012670404|nr:coiled-coil domain-containing protein AGAP005037-like isoform X2 [Photinus pyralis]
MSTDSLISLPPKLSLIPRPSVKRWSNVNGYVTMDRNSCNANNTIPNLIFRSCQSSTLVKLSENSFPVVPEHPINVRIKLSSPEQILPTFTHETGQFPRGYPPSSNAMLFDDDPGIMSEVETSSTGFRRGGKQRSSLPVVRTPSKTLERPLVFLQYRNETKRALLPNEITSIDTVKALFVRSFPKQLSMEYLDSPLVKIYIHDSSKDMFYELEDVRSHLREIRDRSVLRLFESTDVSGGLPMGGVGIPGGVGHFEDPSYFSEPEFDSEYQHQHIHKSKVSALLLF